MRLGLPVYPRSHQLTISFGRLESEGFRCPKRCARYTKSQQNAHGKVSGYCNSRYYSK